MTSPIPADTGRHYMRAAKRRKRAAWWANQIAAATDGREALTIVWRWTLSTLSKIEEHDPRRADAARWHLARELAKVISALPESTVPPRRGLTQDEYEYLLDPSDRKHRR